jgi:transglutaminase-like putative cysteine protease
VYAGASRLSPHQIRLRPREDAIQRLRAFDLRISPEPQGRAWGTDAEGNACLQAWWLGETHHLLVRSSFEVELHLTNPFDFLITESAGSLPFRFSEPEQALASAYLQDPEAAAVREYADQIRLQGPESPMQLLIVLAARIHGELRQTVRESGPPLPPGETLRAGVASCRDTAVLFNAVCRCWGIPARFVSGYERASAQQDHGYMHAWSEVYFPGIGWRGFDASRGLAVSEGHIAVAASRQPEGATPILGHFLGSGPVHMQYSVQLSEETVSEARRTSE